MPLPGVSRKEGRRFAVSRCVQKAEPVFTAYHGVSRKASRLFAAYRCVQEGQSTVHSVQLCPVRRFHSLQLP